MRLMLALVVPVLFLAGCGAQPSDPVDTEVVNGPADAVVVYENPGLTPEPIQAAPTASAATTTATEPGGVEWLTRPHASGPWSVAAAGTLPEGARLYDVVEDGIPPFAIHYPGLAEPLVVLLPDGVAWETNDTVAPTNYEIEGRRFEFEASSPLLGDSGDLELRVLGYQDGVPAVLTVVPIE